MGVLGALGNDVQRSGAPGGEGRVRCGGRGGGQRGGRGGGAGELPGLGGGMEETASGLAARWLE